jgi:hypothetical protein
MEWMDKLKEDLERMGAEGLQALASVQSEAMLFLDSSEATFASESGADVCRATARQADLGFFEMNNMYSERM